MGGKAYPRMPRQPLPGVEELGTACSAPLAGRRASRWRSAADGVSLADLSCVLGVVPAIAPHAAAPTTGPSDDGLETYVAAHDVVGLARTVYHWEAGSRVLEAIPVSEHATEALLAALDEGGPRDTAALVIVTVRVTSVHPRHGIDDDRLIILAAGAAAERVRAAAAARGLCSHLVWLSDSRLDPGLGLEPDIEQTVAALSLARPSASRDDAPESQTSVSSRVTAVATAPPSRRRRAPPFVPVAAIPGLPLWDSPPPGIAALRAAETMLGLRLTAEVPEELLEVPAETWGAYRKLRRLREGGFDVHCTRARSAPDEPAVHRYRVRLGSHHGSGGDAFSAALAMDRAVAEAVERWAWFEATPGPSRLTAASPTALNGCALHLDRLAGYSAALRAAAGASLEWRETTPFVWVAGTSLIDDAPRWVPFQLVSANDGPGETLGVAEEPELRPRVTTGLAAHPDRNAALLNGLLEVVERDAFMVTWLRARPTAVLDLEQSRDERLTELRDRFVAARLEPWVVVLTTDVPIAAVAGLIRDPTGVGPGIAIGAAARPTVADAAIAALTEGFASWRHIRRLMGQGAVSDDPCTLDRDGRLLWWADGDRRKQLAWLLDGPRVPIAEERTVVNAEAELARLLAWFRSTGEDVIAVDLLDEATAPNLGHHVVSVVVPGFHPVHLCEDRPALSSRRLEAVPAALGLAPVLDLNPLPHPFP